MSFKTNNFKMIDVLVETQPKQKSKNLSFTKFPWNSLFFLREGSKLQKPIPCNDLLWLLNFFITCSLK